MAVDLEKELRDLSQLEGRFEFISGQLRDIQLYLHARFDEADARFDRIDAKIDRIDAKIDRTDGKVDGLRRELPDIVASAVVTALREGK